MGFDFKKVAKQMIHARDLSRTTEGKFDFTSVLESTMKKSNELSKLNEGWDDDVDDFDSYNGDLEKNLWAEEEADRIFTNYHKSSGAKLQDRTMREIQKIAKHSSKLLNFVQGLLPRDSIYGQGIFEELMDALGYFASIETVPNRKEFANYKRQFSLALSHIINDNKEWDEKHEPWSVVEMSGEHLYKMLNNISFDWQVDESRSPVKVSDDELRKMIRISLREQNSKKLK